MELSYFIAKELKQYRESNGIKQNYVSDKLKIAQNTLSRIEQNRYAIKIDMVVKLCEIYDIGFIIFMQGCYKKYLDQYKR